MSADPRPSGSGVWRPALSAAPARNLCTDCGVSRTADPKRCNTACQFIKPDYPAMELQVQGRVRDPARPDELFFGPFRRMLRARLDPPLPGAQWTGIVTRLGEKLLTHGKVEAVLAMAPDPQDRWKPVPVIVTQASDMAAVMRMK